MSPAALTAFSPERVLQRKIESRVAMKPRGITISMQVNFTSTGTIMGALFGKKYPVIAPVHLQSFQAHRDLQQKIENRIGRKRPHFSAGTLGNGIQWDTCQPAISISMQVKTVSTSFSGVLFGKAIT